MEKVIFFFLAKGQTIRSLLQEFYKIGRTWPNEWSVESKGWSQSLLQEFYKICRTWPNEQSLELEG